MKTETTRKYRVSDNQNIPKIGGKLLISSFIHAINMKNDGICSTQDFPQLLL